MKKLPKGKFSAKIVKREIKKGNITLVFKVKRVKK